jgi:endonuclease III
MPIHIRGLAVQQLLERRALATLLQSHGQLFSELLGIDLTGLSVAQLFKWFVASLLFGARIRESAAIGTYRELEKRRLLTPRALREADFWQMIDVMAWGGYSRYDGITTRKLQGAAAKLIDEYDGDLNRLHEEAADSADLLVRLEDFWGVGETTAGIFLRELRGLWSKANPPMGDLAQLAATHLRIADAESYWVANRVPGYDFRHFEAALTRVGRDYCRHYRCGQSPVPHNPPSKRPVSGRAGRTPTNGTRK